MCALKVLASLWLYSYLKKSAIHVYVWVYIWKHLCSSQEFIWKNIDITIATYMHKRMCFIFLAKL